MAFCSSCCPADNVSSRCSGDFPGCCTQTACPASGRPACTLPTACRPGASCISRQDIERLLLWKLGLMKCQSNRFCSGWQKRPGVCRSDFFFTDAALAAGMPTAAKYSPYLPIASFRRRYITGHYRLPPLRSNHPFVHAPQYTAPDPSEFLPCFPLH